MPRPGPIALAAALVAVAACSDDVEPLSDFTLDIAPVIPPNQRSTLFADGPSVTVVLREGRDIELTYLGDLSEGSLQATNFRPLVGQMVGILVQDAGGNPAQYEPDRLIAYGEAGPFDLGAGEEQVQASVFLSEVGVIGELGVLGNDAAGMRSAAAMTPDGVTYLFGGSRDLLGTSGVGHSFVQRLANPDDGDWEFDVIGEMPDFDGNGTPDTVVGATATTVDIDGAVQILVTGGRPKNDPFSGNSYNTALFDPETNAFVWSDDKLVGSRAQHQAVRLDNGKVLIIGGMSGSGYLPVATWEIFDPRSKSSEAFSQSIVTSSVGFGLATLGAKGALVCGGALFTRSGTSQWTDPQDACYVIAASGSASEVGPLPVPLQLFAMAPLGDGRVLATGGLTERSSDGQTVPATDRAFVYDPTAAAWTELSAKLNQPRMGHRAVPMPSGKVLIVGGVDGGGFTNPVYGASVECPEVFDPATLEFEVMEPCSVAGSGADPAVAWDPEHGAIVVSGAASDDEGGFDFGILTFGPPF